MRRGAGLLLVVLAGEAAEPALLLPCPKEKSEHVMTSRVDGVVTKPPASMNTSRDLFCGSLAGIVSCAVCYPIDTMRTRLQIAAGSNRSMSLRDLAASTWKREGVRGFYRGCSVPLFAQSVYKAIIFSTSSAVRNALNHASGSQRSSFTHISIAGAVAGAVNSAVVTPVELVRNRLQIQGALGFVGPEYTGPVDVVRCTIRGHGVGALWTGYASTVMRDGPGLALFFLAFEATRRGLCTARGGDEDLRLAEIAFAASCAGVAFWSWALPVDTVKSIVQAAGNEQRSTASIVSEMYSRGGVARFFAGWQAAYIRGIPGATTTLCVHTYCSKMWDEQ